MDDAHPSPANPDSVSVRSSAARTDLISIFVVFASLSLYAAVHSPLPADNESHYMVKAKHYWNPQWCQGDLFLESANAHAVFYQTNGLLTRWLSLEQATQVNRLVAHLLFAIGWVSLSKVLIPMRWAAILAIWFYLALHAYDNLSGEWVIGGVEGKVYSYGLLLWGLSYWLRKYGICFAICFGLAISFHPIVGLWATACILFAELFTRIRVQKWKALSPAKRDLQICLVLLLCALPGLLPALQLLFSGSAEDKLIADYLLVYFRLAHHLDPMHFLRKGITYYMILSVPYLCAGVLLWRQPPWWRLWLFVLAALLVALCGAAAGWGPRPPYEMPYYLDRMKLLKFYPFRLYDACLPIMTAMLATAAFFYWQSRQSNKTLAGFLEACLIGMAVSFVVFMPSKSNQRYQPGTSGWIDICLWIRENTPEDAVFLTPNGNWAFKWYAQREEYLSRKDVPQDAASVVEWNRRIALLQDQRRNGIWYNRADIKQLRSEGVTHLLVVAQQPVDLPLLYRNHWYRLYAIEDP